MDKEPKNMVRPKSAGRGIRIALAVSLAVNLLIVGVVVGAFMSGRGGDRGDRADGRRGGDVAAIGIYGRGLSKADRRAVGEQLRAGSDNTKGGLRAQLRQLGLEAVTVLTAEPFAPEDFAAVLLRQRDLLQSRAQGGLDALVSHISAMSPDARTEYAARLKEALERPAR